MFGCWKRSFSWVIFFSFTRSGKGYIILFSASSEKVTRNPIFWDRPNSLGKSTSLDWLVQEEPPCAKQCQFCGIQSFRTYGRFSLFVPSLSRFVPKPLVDSCPSQYTCILIHSQYLTSESVNRSRLLSTRTLSLTTSKLLLSIEMGTNRPAVLVWTDSNWVRNDHEYESLRNNWIQILPKQVDCFFGDARNSCRWRETYLN